MTYLYCHWFKNRSSTMQAYVPSIWVTQVLFYYRCIIISIKINIKLIYPCIKYLSIDDSLVEGYVNESLNLKLSSSCCDAMLDSILFSIVRLRRIPHFLISYVIIYLNVDYLRVSLSLHLTHHDLHLLG